MPSLVYSCQSSFVSRGVDSQRVQRLSYEWECCCAFGILKYRHACVRPQLTELACSEISGRTGVGAKLRWKHAGFLFTSTPRAPVVRLLASSAWCDSGVSQVALAGGLLLADWRKVNLLNEIFLGH